MGNVGGEEKAKGGIVEYGSSRRHRRRVFKYIIKIGGGNQRAGEEEKVK